MQRQASIAVVCSSRSLAQEVCLRLSRSTPTEISLLSESNPLGSQVTTTLFIPAAPEQFPEQPLGAYLCWGTNAQILVIDSAAGIDSETISLTSGAMQFHPTIIAITGLNHPNSNFDESVAVCQRVFGEDRQVVPVSLPVLNDHEVVQGILDLLTDAIHWFDDSGSIELHDLETEHYELVETRIDELLDAIAITSHDSELVAAIVEGTGIDTDSFLSELTDATLRRELVPVVALEGIIGSELLAQFAQQLGFSASMTWSPVDYAGQEGVIATVLPNNLLRIWQGTVRHDAYRHGDHPVTIEDLTTMSGRSVTEISGSQLCHATTIPALLPGSTISDSGYLISMSTAE